MKNDHETTPVTPPALCTSLDFGKTSPDESCAAFHALLNGAVTDLVRSLPRSTQSSAMIFAMGYAGLHLGDPLDFFRNYYSPIWSSIPHMIKKEGNTILPEGFTGHAAGAHAMAMLLHSLDDHLNDGEVPAGHLTLLIRSQAWKLLHDHLATLCASIPGGAETAAELLDAYYSGITRKDQPVGLDEYLEIFRKQMATGLIVPLLIARLAGGSGLEDGVRASLESFGIAWRILDDIRDLEQDRASGTTSAVSLCLPEEGRLLWGEPVGSEPPGKPGDIRPGLERERAMAMEVILRDSGIIDTLVQRIIVEMGNAAAHAETAGLPGLASEFRLLVGPLYEAQSAKRIHRPLGA